LNIGETCDGMINSEQYGKKSGGMPFRIML
jgi:hypothetical protein